MQAGKSSIQFEHPPIITSAASIVGQTEGEGPLASFFDRVEPDPTFGKKSWEEAESELQRQTVQKCLDKASRQAADVNCLFAGDLLGQIVATSFGVESFDIPFFGLYGACSTMGEAMILGAMAAGAGYADRVLALASSHFASAERQFRFPLAYGNQRPQSTTWTVTGCGCVMIEGNEKNEGKDGRRAKENASESLKNAGQEKLHPKFQPCIPAATPGKIVDMQMRDSMNMGAAMAVAAVDTILQNFRDFNRKPSDYDRIITGDLGMVGKEILLDFMREAGQDISSIHMDCGIEMFDPKTQDTHSGGSGCGCSAAVLCGYILPKIQAGEWKRVLFVPTGALLSQISFNEGQNVPGIAHGVVLEGKESFGE
ncbi:stage V sporulation protein AD [Clostridium fessum]|jgi:stage V sporulation protein AD|uniref:stage V sporulation protein AD n=1 Tax=Clostridium fessum TaxID=2126740 RepID=UPI0022E50BD6|nr:stage V sporulation protein AD [Clostridium fessum]